VQQAVASRHDLDEGAKVTTLRTCLVRPAISGSSVMLRSSPRRACRLAVYAAIRTSPVSSMSIWVPVSSVILLMILPPGDHLADLVGWMWMMMIRGA